MNIFKILVTPKKGNGRPLKYETTRPVSAPNKSRVKSATNRVQSGKPVYIVPTDTSKRGEEFFMTNGPSEDEVGIGKYCIN